MESSTKDTGYPANRDASMVADLVIRADAGATIGTGHLMRCLALAQAWQRKGGRVTFLSHCESELLRHRIYREGFELIFLEQSYPHAADLKQVFRLLKRNRIDNDPPWLALDGYHFDPDYQESIHDSGYRLLVIDDFNHLPIYYADILLNPNIGAERLCYRCGGSPYKIFGSRFVLLRTEFSAWRCWERRISDVGSKILITMGGADPDNVTQKVVTILQRLQLDGLEAIIVAGANNPHIETVRKACERSVFPIRLIRDAQNMAQLMAWADICISGAGTTSWELAYMGLPQVILVLAENQRGVADNLDKFGLTLNLGWYSEINSNDFLTRLRELIFNFERRKSMSENGRRIIDGKGAERVLSTMVGPNSPSLLLNRLVLRRASLEDAELLWEWANDPFVRSNSFNSGTIPIGNHMDWFKEKLATRNTIIYIVEKNRTPIAQIRYDCEEKEYANISFSVASGYRSKGIGEQTLMLSVRKACRELGVKRLQGIVLDHNEASRRTFIKAGFRRIGWQKISDKMCHIFLWECPEKVEGSGQDKLHEDK